MTDVVELFAAPSPAGERESASAKRAAMATAQLDLLQVSPLNVVILPV